MVGVLILSHGPLADEMLAAARVIVGELDGFAALPLGWSDDRELAREKLSAEIARLDRGDGVLILADMFGGTPANVSRELRVPGRVELVSGVNLPMVVRLGCRSRRLDMPLSELASWIRDKGREAICNGDGPCGRDC